MFHADIHAVRQDHANSPELQIYNILNDVGCPLMSSTSEFKPLQGGDKCNYKSLHLLTTTTEHVINHLMTAY